MILFDVVAQEGSFAAAARRCGVTRQSISDRMAKLEAQLGVRLMERTTRSLRLTEAGSIYHARCMALAAMVHEANAEVQGMQREPVGRLRVSVPKIYGRRYLTPVVAELLRRHPRLRIDLVLSDRRVDLVEEGFDAAVRVGALGETSLIARKIGMGRVHYVASPSLLARHGVPEPAQLCRWPCIALRSGEIWEVGGVSSAIDPVLVVNDLEVACDAAIAGVGIAQVPSFVYRDAVADGALTLLFGAQPALTRDIHLVFPSHRYLPPKVRCFVEAVAAQARAVAGAEG